MRAPGATWWVWRLPAEGPGRSWQQALLAEPPWSLLLLPVVALQRRLSWLLESRARAGPLSRPHQLPCGAAWHVHPGQQQMTLQQWVHIGLRTPAICGTRQLPLHGMMHTLLCHSTYSCQPKATEECC